MTFGVACAIIGPFDEPPPNDLVVEGIVEHWERLAEMKEQKGGNEMKLNEYAAQLGRLYDRTPKAVLAAIAVSMLTDGGDALDEAQERLLNEWSILHECGIVPQRPARRGRAGRNV